MDPCLEHPCKNGGYCMLVDTGYQCFCRNGFTGKLELFRQNTLQKTPAYAQLFSLRYINCAVKLLFHHHS